MLQFERTSLHVLLLGGLLLLAACAGPREVTREPGERLPEPAPISMADYEEFDSQPYQEEEPPSEVGIEHDVPQKLMEGRATAGITRTLQGFRIQISNVPSKSEADAQLEEFVSWWNAQKTEGQAGGLFRQEDPPVYIAYRQPYYRVRVGDFASREQAEQALQSVRNRYPGALIVPDMVTITQ